MKKAKLVFLILLAVAVTAGTVAAVRLAVDPERRARRFVNRNLEEITEFAEDYLAAGGADLFKGVSVRAPIPEDRTRVVEFDLGGFGIAPSSTYFSVFYTPEDDPAVPTFFHRKEPLTPDGEGCWRWQGAGDNGGRVVKLADNWYYCEAWF